MKEERRGKKPTHGESRGRKRSPEYTALHGAKQRCYNEKNDKYKDYGGRGIKVCDRWLLSVVNFISDMGRRPSPEHSLERKDVNGDYCKDNCRWAKRGVQASNKRSSTGAHVTVDLALREPVRELAVRSDLGVSELANHGLRLLLESDRMVREYSRAG